MTLQLRNNRRGVLRIDIQIWMPNIRTYAKAPAVFDTGAYKTIIDERLAKLLQIPITGDENTTTVTAMGLVAVKSAVLPKIFLGTKSISNIPVNVMKLPEELETRCILGMNVLREFDIAISSYNGIITLKPNPLPKKFHAKNYSITLTIDKSGNNLEDAATFVTENKE